MLKIWRRRDSELQRPVGDAYELDCWTPYLLVADQPIDLPGSIALERPGHAADSFEYDVNFQDFIGMRHVAGELVRVRSPKLDQVGFDRLLADLHNSCCESALRLPVAYFCPTRARVCAVRRCAVSRLRLSPMGDVRGPTDAVGAARSDRSGPASAVDSS